MNDGYVSVFSFGRKKLVVEIGEALYWRILVT
jgi:hypothetical protein